ncbi:MAG TPA: PQQ-binding-like beta-propeller repeat protein, partial [Planctomycetaceae bacterium]|nr:PQQ-binding-like beta-propeller repeat protein [Planctomycetaceae bacterium]
SADRTFSASEITSVRTPSFTWPALFGPSQDSRSREDATKLRLDWPETGPPVVWRSPLGSAYSSPIVSGDYLIVFHRVADEEILECKDSRTGETRWTFRGPTSFRDSFEYSSGPHATPVTDGDRVYAVGAEGRFYCVDLRTGERIWSRFLTREYDVPRGRYAVSGSPLLEGDLLIFNLGARERQAGIIALDKNTGETVWTATDHGAGLATPRAAEIHGTRSIFVFTFDGLVCLAPETGQVRWIEDFRANNPERINTSSPLVWEDLVLVSAHFKGSRCLRVLPNGERETVWETVRDLQSQYSTVLGIDGFAYAFHAGNKTLRCVNLRDGTVNWQWPEPGIEGIGRGTAIAIGNRLVVYGEHGHLASLEMNSQQPVVKSLTSVPLLQQPCYSSPAFANGLLYLTNEREIVCFDLRAAGQTEL